MAGIIGNYPELCRKRATDPKYPLVLIDSLKREFDKGMRGGVVASFYLREKLNTLSDFVKWIEEVEED